MTIHILLYKTKGLIGSLIRWQTRSRYSHAALLFDKTMVIESHFKTGVISRNVEECDLNAHACTFEVSEENALKIKEWSIRTIGYKYDWQAILRFLSRRRMTNDFKWFCSEHVFEALLQGNVRLLINTESWEVSPGLLSRSPLLQRHGPLKNVKENDTLYHHK